MKTFLLTVLVSTLVSSTAEAQATAQIHGTIQDTSGAAVAGAEVKAIQTDTGVTHGALVVKYHRGRGNAPVRESLREPGGVGLEIVRHIYIHVGNPVDDPGRHRSGTQHNQSPTPAPGDPHSVYSGHSGPGAFYLNKPAFAPQPLGTVGNLGWNSLVTPAYWDIDWALSREFRFTDRHRLELRADAFNLPNTFVPIAVPTTGLAGSATSATGTQFGAPHTP